MILLPYILNVSYQYMFDLLIIHELAKSKDFGVLGLVPIRARTLNCTGQFVQTLFEQGSLAIVTLLRQTLRSFCVIQI